MFKKKNEDKETKKEVDENVVSEKDENETAKAKTEAVDELTLTQQKCEEYLHGWKRAQADYQNLKKENDKERSEFIKYANANLLTEILPVYDNFKSAFRQIPENEKNSAWVIGFSYIKKQLADLLSTNGITEIKTVGEKFDHNLHEALEYRETDGEDGIIIEELKAGYKLNEKVIQAAKVVVGKATEQLSNEATEQGAK
ncbi:MAG: nucleotide exchange factor GrpE [Patescibacteria group bacterium]